jgi:hypothetical protein
MRDEESQNPDVAEFIIGRIRATRWLIPAPFAI